jgi:hypothetical protein
MSQLVTRAEPDSGFSLLDAIVAMALVAMIMATMTASYPLVIQALSRVGVFSQAVEDHRTLNFISEVIRRARPITFGSRERLGEVLFTGTSDRLQAVADLANTGAVGGPYSVDFKFEPLADGKAMRLVLERRLHRWQETASDDKAAPDRRILIEQLQQARFQYFGRIPAPANSTGVQRAWQTDWRGRDRLPELVMIEFELGSGQGVQRLIVRPEQRR